MHPTQGQILALVLAAMWVLVGHQLWAAMRYGRLKTRGVVLERAGNPFWFWLSFLMIGAAFLFLSFVIIGLLFPLRA